MRLNVPAILDWLLFMACVLFIFMAMDILPALWFVLNLIAGKDIEYFPGIFIAVPLLALLFYTAFIKKQRNIYSYVWYIVLTVIMVQVYYMIEGPYNRMHIFLYFIVSILSFRLLRHYFHDTRLYFAGFFMTAILGLVDEFAQLFSAYRGFCVWDIKADALAALLGQLFIMLVIRPDLNVWIPKLKRKISGYHAQEKWLKKRKPRF